MATDGKKQQPKQVLLEEVHDESTPNHGSSNRGRGRGGNHRGAAMPVSSSSRGPQSTVLFYSSVLKPGGATTNSESEAMQQLVRSGVIRPTSSNFGRTLSKVRQFNTDANRDRETLQESMRHRSIAEAQEAALKFETENPFELYEEDVVDRPDPDMLHREEDEEMANADDDTHTLLRHNKRCRDDDDASVKKPNNVESPAAAEVIVVPRKRGSKSTTNLLHKFQ